MIDNRSILVLAVTTVEKIEDVIGESTIDQERVLPVLEAALTEAFKQGFAQGLRQQDSEKEAKHDRPNDA